MIPDYCYIVKSANEYEWELWHDGRIVEIDMSREILEAIADKKGWIYAD